MSWLTPIVHPPVTMHTLATLIVVVAFTVSLLLSTSAEARNSLIAIVGGGVAGLSAYRHLRDRLSFSGNPSIRLYEGNTRLGGRVYPDPLLHELQHGAEWVNGDGHAIYRMAEELGVLNGRDDDDVLMRSVEYRWIRMEGREVPVDVVERFRKFSSKLELRYLELAAREENWERTIGEVYRRDYEDFLEVE